MTTQPVDPVRVGIVAGEASGDFLGAGFMRELRARIPQVHFEGVAGPRMIAEGCEPLGRSDEIALVGLFEVVRRLPGLMALKRRLLRHFRARPPHVFIGIDVPDFNLRLERALKARGVRTVHYVGPQVWAWRPARVHKIRRALDLMLTLFPFEDRFYRRYEVPVTYVGHPLADEIPLEIDRAGPRTALGLSQDAPVVALLPGSRVGELRNLGESFVRAAAWLAERVPGVRFVAPMSGPETRQVFEAVLARHGVDLDVRLLDGQAREAMAAADVVLAASGTATLEAMLLKRPMVVAYRLTRPTYWLARRMVRLQHFALPNLLAEEAVVPEFLQDEATPENLGEAVRALLVDGEAAARQQALFTDVHQTLRQHASAAAAEAVLNMLRADPAMHLGSSHGAEHAGRHA